MGGALGDPSSSRAGLQFPQVHWLRQTLQLPGCIELVRIIEPNSCTGQSREKRVRLVHKGIQVLVLGVQGRQCLRAMRRCSQQDTGSWLFKFHNVVSAIIGPWVGFAEVHQSQRGRSIGYN